MTTKEKILHESLRLFSINGFEAVSMRDIGAAVGIRESSIYKHYSGKQKILDAIVLMAIAEIDNMLISLNIPSPNNDSTIFRYTNMEIEDISCLCTKMLLAQMDNEIVARFRQVVTIEQYRNKKLRKIYIEMFMERQLQYNEKVFEYLIHLGILKGTSAKLMALEFFSPFFLLQYKLQDNKELLESTLKEHIVSFIKEHLGETEL